MINAYCCLTQLFAEYLLFLEFEMFSLLGVKQGLHEVNVVDELEGRSAGLSMFLDFGKVIPVSGLF